MSPAEVSSSTDMSYYLDEPPLSMSSGLRYDVLPSRCVPSSRRCQILEAKVVPQRFCDCHTSNFLLHATRDSCQRQAEGAAQVLPSTEFALRFPQGRESEPPLATHITSLLSQLHLVLTFGSLALDLSRPPRYSEIPPAYTRDMQADHAGQGASESATALRPTLRLLCSLATTTTEAPLPPQTLAALSCAAQSEFPDHPSLAIQRADRTPPETDHNGHPVLLACRSAVII